MKIRFLFICCVIFLVNISLVQSQVTIPLTDYGVKASSFENASPGIRKAIAACKGKANVTLVLPGGRVDIWPEGAEKRELYISNTTENDTLSKVKNIGFLFEGAKNLTLEGNNTLVVLHGKMISFAVINCENIGIKNISFDYERPTMSEMTIKSVSDHSVMTEIHPDSKFSIENGKISFYGEGWKSKSYHTILVDPEKDVMRYSSFEPFLKSKAIQTHPSNVNFEGDFSKMNLQPGNVLTMRDPYRDNCGGFITLSKNIDLDNVKMHFMHGLGIVSQFSENITLRKVVAAPREKSGRIIASFADCFHFSGCKGLITLDSCTTSGSHDDPVNIHGTHLSITGVTSQNMLTVRFMHHQTYGFEAFCTGDSIAFTDPQTLQYQGFAQLKSARLINKRELEIEIAGALPQNIKTGYVIENITWTPEVIIRNCRFERTNTRGLLLTTRRKVLIENNTFYRTGMHAILIADDAASWYESGPVQDVTIRNNTFQECGYNSAPNNYVIAIAPENHKLIPGFMVHRNIRIENNIFKVYDYPILTARSTGNLVFTGNKIIRTDFMKPKGDIRPQFNLNACSKVQINKNEVSGFDSMRIQAKSMAKKEISTDLKTTFIK